MAKFSSSREHEPAPATHEHGRDVAGSCSGASSVPPFSAHRHAGHLRPGEECTGDEADGHPARFWVKLANGRFCSPQSFQLRTRSSTRA